MFCNINNSTSTKNQQYSLNLDDSDSFPQHLHQNSATHLTLSTNLSNSSISTKCVIVYFSLS